MGGKASPGAAQVSDEHKKAEKERTEAHIKTLDDLVSVNSLFTLAVFVGLSQASPGAISLENRQECNAGPGVAKMLVLYEVVAFACFLLSSLVAKVIKLLLGLDSERFKLVQDRFDLKDFLLILTASASVSGIILLTLSVVNIVQIRIAIWALGTIVGIALAIYVLALIIAIYASITTDGQYSVNSKTNSDEKKGDNQKDESSGLIEGRSAV
ncbi:hypothetical protein DCAR_0209685 [Daucus carota subsp. sativus]|uniref:Uncharacterized protein n=1 Tax=Daucus carota subsp. sativus TaxID=79200 RepID=A0AAF0WJE8_DAUCS|nr:hypothetical protein DCAR_0209685 [Daucus carota subsp. sativus]